MKAIIRGNAKRGPKGTVLFGPLAEKGAKQNRPLWLPFAPSEVDLVTQRGRLTLRHFFRKRMAAVSKAGPRPL